ncbi:hypothetical protein PQR39_35445 [Paraburkholderia sediminicola]|uniref:hypothetical protein n=1 Tax=Paraburkholderia sediminicola TaxID=458836 RepID=UPI0038B76D3E
MPSNHTSVYMRGLFDGLREGMSKEMTPKKFKLTLDSMTAISRKVFEAVPIQESWTANQIVTALARTTSTRPDLKTATGCLDTLKQCGLVKETERGLFRQVVPRESALIDGVKNDIPPEARPDFTKHADQFKHECEDALDEATQDYGSNPQDTSPADALGTLAVTLRTKADSLIKMADALETLALDFEQRIEDANKRLERFNQLKALLTS